MQSTSPCQWPDNDALLWFRQNQLLWSCAAISFPECPLPCSRPCSRRPTHRRGPFHKPTSDPAPTRLLNKSAHSIKKSPKLRRSEEHTSELQSRPHLVCRLLLEKKKIKPTYTPK